MPASKKINLWALQQNFMNEKHEVSSEDKKNKEDLNTENKKVNISSEIKNIPHKIKWAETVSKKENKTDGKKNKDLFQNYQSIFTRERETILQKIKKVKIVKTRPQLVAGLIWCTLMIIAGLFLFDPSRHSLSIYQASLLQSYNSVRGIETPVVQPIKFTAPIKAPKKNNIVIQNRVFTIYSTTSSWQTLFGYKGNDFNSQEEVEAYIKKEIFKQTKEKIIEHVWEK